MTGISFLSEAPLFIPLSIVLIVMGAAPVVGVLIVCVLVSGRSDLPSLLGMVQFFALPFGFVLLERMLSKKYLALSGLKTGTAFAVSCGGVYALDPASVTTLIVTGGDQISLLAAFGRTLSLSLVCFSSIVVFLLCMEIPVRIVIAQNRADVIPWELIRFWALIWVLAIGGHLIVFNLLR